MKTKLLSVLIVGLYSTIDTTAQTNTFPVTGSAGIGTLTPNGSSILDISSTSKGILFPRMTKAQRDVIVTPATGLIIYQTDQTPGFYFYNGSVWSILSSGSGANTTLSNLAATSINQSLLPSAGNTFDLGTSGGKGWKNIYFNGAIYFENSKFVSNTGTNSTFTGLQAGMGNTGIANAGFGMQTLLVNTTGSYNTTVGSQSMYNNSTGSNNTAIGSSALFYNNTGAYNTGVGYQVLYYNTVGFNNTAHGAKAMYSNTVGNFNTALGLQALYSNTSGHYNTATGANSLYKTTTGSNNSASGYASLYYNTTGYDNTASGNLSLYANTTGFFNTAHGSSSLKLNTTGSSNTAGGYSSMYANTTGYNNAAYGVQTLQANTTGNENAATGYRALYSNTTGYDNTAMGTTALYYNSSGAMNTAIGYNALGGSYNGYANTAVGTSTGTGVYTYSYCSFFGYLSSQNVGGDLSNSTALGAYSKITADEQVRIGNSQVTSIGGYTGWTNISDGRYKKEIRENVPGLAFINKLKPVTYHLNISAIRGFLGEEQDEDKNMTQGDKKARRDEAVRKKEGILYSGFVAQDVEKVAKELGYDFSGVDAPKNDKSLYGLRYAEFVVPLVKSVQELSKMNNEKDEQIAALEKHTKLQNKINEELQKQIDELKAMIQPVTQTSATSATQITKPQPANSVVTLGQNVPNPVTNSCIIHYTVPQGAATTQLRITDTNGKLIKQFSLAASVSGSVNIDASILSNGVYYYTLLVDGKVAGSRKMIVAK